MRHGRGAGAVAGILLLLSAQVAWGQEEKPPPIRLETPPSPESPRPQDVSLGYRWVVSYPRHIDRENIASEATAAMDLLHLGLQDSGTDGAALRILKWGIAAWIDESVLYVAHEYGHISTVSKTGFRDAVEGNVNDATPPGGRVTPFSLFVEGLRFPAGRIISVSDSDWSHIDSDFAGHPVERLRFAAALEAGGINQEHLVKERYVDRLMDGNLSYLDTVPFAWGVVSTLTYPTGIKESDLDDYASNVRQQGIRTTTARIKALSAIEFLSGSSLASAWGFGLGLLTGRAGHVEPILFNVGPDARVALPEFSSLLSEIGPTLKAAFPLRVAGWAILPSYETLVASGAGANEGGFEIRGPLAEFLDLRVLSFVSDQPGRWLEGGLDLRPLSWLAISLGYVSARGYTFHRDLYGAGNDYLDKEERSFIAGLVLWKRF